MLDKKKILLKIMFVVVPGSMLLPALPNLLPVFFWIFFNLLD